MDDEEDLTRVFVSHRWAYGEQYFAIELATRIGQHGGPGFEVILDKTHLFPGVDIAEWMRRMIRISDALVYLLSPAANESEACQKELRLAKRHRKPIIPVMLRQAKPPKVIAKLFYLDFTDRSDLFSLVDELVKAIRYHRDIARERAKLPPIPPPLASSQRAPRPVKAFALTEGILLQMWLEGISESPNYQLCVELDSIVAYPRDFQVRVTDQIKSHVTDMPSVLGKGRAETPVNPRLVQVAQSRIGTVSVTVVMNNVWAGGWTVLGSWEIEALL